MGFSEFDFAKPTIEEIKQVKWAAENNPEDLDSRELWILENQLFFVDDENEEVIDYE
jgi:hypothetical protein